MENFMTGLDNIKKGVLGIATVMFISLVGIYYTIRLRGFQFRRFSYAIGHVFSGLKNRKSLGR